MITAREDIAQVKKLFLAGYGFEDIALVVIGRASKQASDEIRRFEDIALVVIGRASKQASDEIRRLVKERAEGWVA